MNRDNQPNRWRVASVTLISMMPPVCRHSSLPKLIALPNGAYITNTYDDMARLTGTYMKNSSHSVLDSAVYGYNAGSQRTAFTNAAGTHVGYAYDSIGQLKLADSSVNTEDKGYLYDAAWNLTTRTNNAGNDDFTVDSKNQLSSTPLGSPFYDGNGNLYLIIGGPEWHWGYDAENQMTSHYNGVEDKTYGFAYDGLGRLRQRWELVWDEGEQAWLPAGIINYIYDGRRVIQERTASPIAPVTSYTRGIDLSGTLEGAGGIGGLLARTGHSGTGGSTLSHAYYHADGNGNITYLIDNSQSMVASYRYDPFGNTLSQSGTLADANLYRFSSKEIHAPSGMYYYGYRWYEPNLQRWLNRDPIQEKGGLNLYGFVANNPVNKFDPDGRQFYEPPLDDKRSACDIPCWLTVAASVRASLSKAGIDRTDDKGGGNAFQHCLLACRVSKVCGENGRDWLDSREDTKTKSGEMDDANNKVGYGISGDCWSGCMKAWNDGKLTCMEWEPTQRTFTCPKKQ